MKYAKYDYVHGSTAEKQYSSSVREEKKLRNPIRYKRKKNAVKLASVCFLVIAFVASMLLVQRYVKITEMNYQYNADKEKYSSVKDENSKLKVAIEKDTDLQKIKKRAEEMGMQKPDNSQIVYIMVPKSDSLEVSEEYKDKSGSNIESNVTKSEND